MGTAKHIARNTFFVIAGSAIQKVLSLVLVVLIAQKLGVLNFGIYSFVFSFVALFVVIVDLGITTLVFREIAKTPKLSSKLLGSAFLVKLFLSVGVFALISVLIFLMHLVDPVKYPWLVVALVSIAGISMILDSLAGLFRTVFCAFERFKFELIVSTVYKTLLFALSMFVLFGGYGLFELIVVAVIASFINLLFAVVLSLKKFTGISVGFDKAFMKSLIVRAIPFVFVSLFASILANVDTLMLSIIKGNLAVAFYSVAYRMVHSLAILSQPLMMVIYPVFARFYGSSKASIPALLNKSMYVMMIIILPIAFGTTLLASRLVDVLFSTPASDFSPAVLPLQIMVWYCVFAFTGAVMLHALLGTAFEKRTGFLMGLYVLVNIILNLALIPLYSATGAAIATLVSQVFFFVFVYRSMDRLKVKPALFQISFKPLIASIIMSGFVLLAFSLNLWIIIVLAGIVYFTALYAIGGISKQDIALLKKSIGR